MAHKHTWLDHESDIHAFLTQFPLVYAFDPNKPCASPAKATCSTLLLEVIFIHHAMLRIEIVSDRYAFYTRRATGIVVCGDKYGIRTFRLSIRSADDIECEALRERYAPAHPIRILELYLQRLGSNPQAMVAQVSGDNARRSIFVSKVSDVLEHLFHKDSVDGAYFQSGESEGNKGVVNALGCSEKLECTIQAKCSGSEVDEWTEDTHNDNPGVDDAVDKNWARLLVFKQDSLTFGMCDKLLRGQPVDKIGDFSCTRASGRTCRWMTPVSRLVAAAH